MNTKTEKPPTKEDTKSVQTIETMEKIVGKESVEKQMPFREAVKGFWEKFDNIYGTNLTHEKIRDYDYRSRI